METKETIAVLGLKKGEAVPFLDKLANNHRLLIVLGELNDCTGVSEYLPQNKPKQEVELIDCPKEGCWEADHIILWNPIQFKEEELLKLREVATQKIILLVKEREEDRTNHSLFPNSRIVTLILDPITKEGKISGDNPNAVDTIYKLISKTEYSIIEKKKIEE